MIATLVVALSLAASAPAMEVPFLPQTDALCGGAAAAMVFRYWGDAHADGQEFAPLVDRRAGGIVNTALVDAVRARGWRTAHVDGSFAALKARIDAGQPVIVLVPERGNRYHYVVVTGASDDEVVVHDPSWGPSRPLPASDFERAWRAAQFWSLVILPPTARAAAAISPEPASTDASASAPVNACDARLARAVAEIRERGLEHADAILGRVRADCPAAAGPLRELSGVRFAERRWDDAAALARSALERDPHDAYALEVLGSSLFMRDDAVGALRAWNRIDKPRVNLVRIEGVRHTRQQTIAEILGIHANMLLDADLFERARRRVSELPGQSAAILKVRPEADGFATVDVVVAERPAIPRGAAAWAGAGVRAAIDREVGVTVPGGSGQGEVWSASWRWWRHRPRVAVGFAAPGRGGLPGIWRVEGSWEAESYATGAAQGVPAIRQTRAHGGLTMSDWLSGATRYSLSAGLDSWSGVAAESAPSAELNAPSGRKTVSIGATIDRRFRRDRVSLSGAATRWMPIGAGPAFGAAGVRAVARSSNEMRGWVFQGTAGADRASNAAPLGLWPGAGDGRARVPLVRAHPLLDDGVISLAGPSIFGRTLGYGSVEAQRWLERPTLVRIAPAGFVDLARASRRGAAAVESAQVDVGAGLRIKVPGATGLLRVDVARGLRDGATAVTIGWLLDR
jgi:predicted double-glycine peptidase